MIRDAELTAVEVAKPVGRVGRTNVLGEVVAGLLALTYLVPLVFMLLASLETNVQFMRNAASWPTPIQWANYVDAWVRGTLGSYFGNTLLYTFTIVTGTLAIATMAAYPIARQHLRGANSFYLYFLSGLLLPVGLIPQFFVMMQLNLYDTRIGYIVLGMSRIALPIFILTGFIKSIPAEIDDAAAIDGCGYLRFVFEVIVPLLTPALVVVGLIVAIGVWNDLIGPVVFLPSNDLKPISAGLFAFYSQFTAQWTYIAAAIVLTAWPIVVLFLFTQRYIVAGIIGGAIKG